MNYTTIFPLFGSRRNQWISFFRAEHLCFFTMIQGTVLYFETDAWMTHSDTFYVGNGPGLRSLDTPCGLGCASPKFGLAAVVTLGDQLQRDSTLDHTRVWVSIRADQGRLSWPFLVRMHPHVCEKLHGSLPDLPFFFTFLPTFFFFPPQLHTCNNFIAQLWAVMRVPIWDWGILLTPMWFSLH